VNITYIYQFALWHLDSLRLPFWLQFATKIKPHQPLKIQNSPLGYQHDFSRARYKSNVSDCGGILVEKVSDAHSSVKMCKAPAVHWGQTDSRGPRTNPDEYNAPPL
jgi:hypothetical protein